jgi:hypothetical protein
MWIFILNWSGKTGINWTVGSRLAFWQFEKGNFDSLKREILTVWKGNFDSLKRKILTVWKGNFDSLKNKIQGIPSELCNCTNNHNGNPYVFLYSK